MASNWTPTELAEKLEANPDLTAGNSLAPPERITYPKTHPSASGGKTKYRSRATIYNGVRYASQKEARKAEELTLIQRAGKIKGFISQIPFHLPGNSVHRVDFGIINLDNTVTWLEIKGRDLALGKLKRRQVEELYGIRVRVE